MTGLRRIGLIGIGAMGKPMGINAIKAGHHVSVYARNRDKAADLLTAGADWAASPREIAAASETILLVLPDLPEAEAVLAGPEGILAGLSGDTVLVICSTSSPAGVRELGERLSRQTEGALSVVDAPISGGEEGAIAGTLSIMVGGAPGPVARVVPVLESMGTPVHLGPLGAGQIAKACNQMIVAANMLAIAEASTIAERSGLDLRLLLPLLNGGSAASRMLETKMQRFIDRDYSPSGIAKYMTKDLAFAISEAKSTATHTPQLFADHNAFIELVEGGYGELDISSVQAFVAEYPHQS